MRFFFLLPYSINYACEIFHVALRRACRQAIFYDDYRVVGLPQQRTALYLSTSFALRMITINGDEASLSATGMTITGGIGVCEWGDMVRRNRYDLCHNRKR